MRTKFSLCAPYFKPCVIAEWIIIFQEAIFNHLGNRAKFLSPMVHRQSDIFIVLRYLNVRHFLIGCSLTNLMLIYRNVCRSRNSMHCCGILEMCMTLRHKIYDTKLLVKLSIFFLFLYLIITKIMYPSPIENVSLPTSQFPYLLTLLQWLLHIHYLILNSVLFINEVFIKV